MIMFDEDYEPNPFFEECSPGALVTEWSTGNLLAEHDILNIGTLPNQWTLSDVPDIEMEDPSQTRITNLEFKITNLEARLFVMEELMIQKPQEEKQDEKPTQQQSRKRKLPNFNLESFCLEDYWPEWKNHPSKSELEHIARIVTWYYNLNYPHDDDKDNDDVKGNIHNTQNEKNKKLKELRTGAILYWVGSEKLPSQMFQTTVHLPPTREEMNEIVITIKSWPYDKDLNFWEDHVENYRFQDNIRINIDNANSGRNDSKDDGHDVLYTPDGLSSHYKVMSRLDILTSLVSSLENLPGDVDVSNHFEFLVCLMLNPIQSTADRNQYQVDTQIKQIGSKLLEEIIPNQKSWLSGKRLFANDQIRNSLFEELKYIITDEKNCPDRFQNVLDAIEILMQVICAKQTYKTKVSDWKVFLNGSQDQFLNLITRFKTRYPCSPTSVMKKLDQLSVKERLYRRFVMIEKDVKALD